ncbi:MAG: hypothetical protein Q8O35_13695, partial [Humidesulfovibrio sp.]|uniref:hypothetical protein n=1 Tax=Humidesulfovibrio sp. TaxID=2910988 RepID=UPI0027345D37
MPDNVARLLKMAEAEFPDLTEPEREVVRCAANGELADLSPLGPPTPPELETKLAKKFNPGGRQLRSAVVEWLCTDERVKNRVHRKGVFIIHASLDEVLDLQHADVPFFFGLHACRLPGLDAQGARIGSNLYLRLCHIDGRFDLNSSRIGGQLLCDGTRVQGADGISIRADGADIGGIVFLSNGFRAVGEVRLLGAKIKGQLNCKNGHFQNHDGKALNLDNAAIEYDVLLSEGFQAVGEVRLMGAKIQGQLNCNGGTFQNEAGYAVNLHGAVISDAMFLEPKRLRGEVGLHGAEVTGTLRMLSDSTAKASLDLRSA